MNRADANLYCAIAYHVVGDAREPCDSAAKRGKGARPVRRAYRLAALIADTHQHDKTPDAPLSWNDVWAARCQLGVLGAIPFAGVDNGGDANTFCKIDMAAYIDDLRRAMRALALALEKEPNVSL